MHDCLSNMHKHAQTNKILSVRSTGMLGLRFKISQMGVASINSFRNANKALLFKRCEGEGTYGCMREACDDSFGVYV